MDHPAARSVSTVISGVRVARQAELDAQRRGPGEGLGVVREQEVGDVPPDQSFDAAPQGGGLAHTGAFALVVDPDQIDAAGIGQVDGAPDRRAGHEVPDVEVAEVDDAQPVQTGG
jgi:hypothetical protein